MTMFCLCLPNILFMCSMAPNKNTIPFSSDWCMGPSCKHSMVHNLSICTLHYCKFGNFREDFIFPKLRIYFVKIKPPRNDEINLSFTDIGKSCISPEFFMSQIWPLTLFAKIKFLRKFPNRQYMVQECSLFSYAMLVA